MNTQVYGIRETISVSVREIEYVGECVLGNIPHGGIRTGTPGGVLQVLVSEQPVEAVLSTVGYGS